MVAALVEKAIAGDVRAQTLVWERVEGKVRDELAVTSAPEQMSEEQLLAFLAALPEA